MFLYVLILKIGKIVVKIYAYYEIWPVERERKKQRS